MLNVAPSSFLFSSYSSCFTIFKLYDPSTFSFGIVTCTVNAPELFTIVTSSYCVPPSNVASTLLIVYCPLFSVLFTFNVIIPENDEYSSGGLTSLIVIVSCEVVSVIAISSIDISPFESVSTCLSASLFTFTANIAPPSVSCVCISSFIILKL